MQETKLHFRWIDGSTVYYGEWAEGYPLDDKYGKPCAYITAKTEGIFLLYCNDYLCSH